MRNFLVIFLISIALAAQATPAVELESFVNQNDQLFSSSELIRPGERSSLCGPTTLLNLVQFLRSQESQPLYSKEALVDAVVKSHRQALPNINIMNGLIPTDLATFAKILLPQFELPLQWTVQDTFSTHALDYESLMSERPSVLMLHFAEVSRPRIPIHRSDDFDNFEVRGNHFVLKIYADRKKEILWLIDPEEPNRITKVKVHTSKDSYKREIYFIEPTSPMDFRKLVVPGRLFQWNITSQLTPQL